MSVLSEHRGGAFVEGGEGSGPLDEGGRGLVVPWVQRRRHALVVMAVREAVSAGRVGSVDVLPAGQRGVEEIASLHTTCKWIHEMSATFK